MESLILEDLRSLGKSISVKEFRKSINGGPKSIKYTQLVEWITKEIQILLGLEEHVNSISSEADSSSFLLEVSSFLKESGCSYNTLIDGHFENRLNSDENKLLLLDYLIGELRASRIINASTTNTKCNMQVTLIESNTSKYVKEILMTLKFPKPPQNINTSSLFNKVNTKLQDLLKTVPPALIGKSLVCNSYTSEQWKYINTSIELLNEEFNIRSKMLLTRLDVTVQSFKWPDRLKNKKQKLEEIYQTKLNLINKLPNFCTSDFLLARDDLAIVEKTSSMLAVQNTNSSVNKVMIGQVPDRGGRPNEQQAPPPEMPSWQQRTQSQGGRGGQSNRGSQSNRGVQFNSRGQGGSPQNRDNQSYRNSDIGGFQGGSNVYQMTDGFQSISVGNESRNFHQNNRRGRVQGGWNNNQSRDFHGSNHEGQSRTYDNYNQGTYQNKGYDNNRFQGIPNERQRSQDPQNYYGNSQDPQNYYGNSQDQYGGNNREYTRHDSADVNRRGYSKRGRGHNGQTYYNQQRNN
ncbi:protein FAM98A [Acyrthosiphon pisum]|uniref:Protein FAM98A n=1 Tax=Acyrthosiphon pisum TaxID=7029 RepID=A0A8R1W8Z1_ACYPI|nr:protein FAM98A [Acyrthosiphon pisum]XP_003242790.1 protein FAM98A [Acyrthosiphon pisum]|eukprot:XP_001943023.1 PREDICTED: protein FAM98A [Acyrthosiphon pisum]